MNNGCGASFRATNSLERIASSCSRYASDNVAGGRGRL
jgi:hypothetical protein